MTNYFGFRREVLKSVEILSVEKLIVENVAVEIINHTYFGDIGNVFDKLIKHTFVSNRFFHSQI